MKINDSVIITKVETVSSWNGFNESLNGIEGTIKRIYTNKYNKVKYFTVEWVDKYTKLKYQFNFEEKDLKQCN
jgi:hypothetical protein